MRFLVAIAFIAAACTNGLPTAAPQDPETLLRARTSGVTLSPGDAGAADLDGGPYRIAWVAQACSYFQIAWMPASGEARPIEVEDASGEVFVDLPAGPGSLDRAADCDYTVRFETAQ